MTTPITLKDITIHPVIEQQGPFFDVMGFFPTITKELLDENRSWLQPTFLDPADKLMLCIQSFVIKTPHHNILVDACGYNYKPRPRRPFWHMMNSDRFEKGLEGSGSQRRRYRLCDVHAPAHRSRRLEHKARERPLGADIPHRVIHTGRPRTHALDGAAEGQSRQRALDYRSRCCRSSPLKPRADRQEDFAFSDDVQFIPTPGHTIDHFSVLVGRTGTDALITGDMIHSPLQGKYPELGMMADYDSTQAGTTRRKVFDRFCEEPTIMCATHFPAPSTGRVRRWGDGFKFVGAAD